jgi:protein subunit release factor B
VEGVVAKERVLHLTKKDFVMTTFRVSGAGGQRRDKVETGVRFTHPPSGAVGEATESRRQIDNKRMSFRRMADSKEFRAWLGIEHQRAVGAAEAWVEEQMRPENLIIEFGPFGE